MTDTEHVPVDDPDSVVKAIVCDATTAPLADTGAGAVATGVGVCAVYAGVEGGGGVCP